VKPTVALNLALEAVKQVALEFRNLSATQARHMDVIPLRPSLVVVLLALEVHQVEFVDESMTLEKVKRPVNGNPIHLRINFASLAQDLAGIEMLLGSFNHTKDGPSLPRHAQTSRHEFSLQAARSFGLGQWHSRTPRCKSVANITRGSTENQTDLI